ncbi:MAG TPA: hypothetical protein VH025_00815 [Solirubrobacteraceae bacterium]|nr:hypothetical protein [Solirubrobacteraceae bacterium]
MSEASELAQQHFFEDLAPLLREGELSLWRERPGLLEFVLVDRPGMVVIPGSSLQAVKPAGGQRVLVEFEASTAGTTVKIAGRCEGHVRDVLAHLGTPGHWPVTDSGAHAPS